jgi:hypothetical protein
MLDEERGGRKADAAGYHHGHLEIASDMEPVAEGADHVEHIAGTFRGDELAAGTSHAQQQLDFVGGGYGRDAIGSPEDRAERGAHDVLGIVGPDVEKLAGPRRCRDLAR